MKVFHIISRFDLGGAERVAMNIAKSDNKDFEYHIVEVFRGKSTITPALLEEMRTVQITYHRSPFVVLFSIHYLLEKLSALLFPLWFFFIYRKYRPDVIHCHTDIPELATFCFFKLFPQYLKRCKVVRTIHNTKLWNGMERMGAKVEKFLQFHHANIAISSSVQLNYLTTYGEKPPIIYNGVEEPIKKKKYNRLRENKMNILFAGRFETQKGITHLIKIIQLLATDDRYYFHIIGDGRLKELIIESLKDCPNVEISDSIHGLSQYLSSFDYLLMPSEHEGLSMLSMEASFSHLPVIINNCEGLKDTLPNDWPLKVEGNNIDAYMNIFHHILPSADTKIWGDKAYEFAKLNFSIKTMQTKYESVYDKSFRLKSNNTLVPA